MIRIAVLALCLMASAPKAHAQLLQGADRIVFVSGDCSSLIIAGKESPDGCQDQMATVRYAEQRRATVFFAGVSDAGAYERVSFVGPLKGDPGVIDTVHYRSAASEADVTVPAIGYCRSEISERGLTGKMSCEAKAADGRRFAGEFAFRTAPNNSYAIID